MSEGYPKPLTPADFREKAVEHAQGELYDEMMMERGGLPLPQEELQDRPYLDKIGRPRQSNGKMARTKFTDKDQRLAYLDGAQSVGTLYEEMSNEQLREYLSKVEEDQGHEALRSVVGEVASAIETKREQKLRGDKEGYQAMGMLELAGVLGEAEGSGKKAEAKLVEDALIDKWIEKTQKIGEYGDEPSGGTLTIEERENKLWESLMQTKDRHAQKYKVDGNLAADKMHQLQDAGVPDEIIESIPISYFYNENDPGVSDDEGDMFKKWLEAHPDIEDKLTDKAANGLTVEAEADAATDRMSQDEIRTIANSVLGSDTEEPAGEAPKLGLKAKFKDLWSREAAVTFNKKPNGVATVDTDPERRVKVTKKHVAMAVGAVALGAAGYFAARYNVDLWPFGDPSVPSVDENGNNGLDIPNDNGHSGTSVPDTKPEGNIGITETRSINTDKYPTVSHIALDLLQDQGLSNPSDQQIHQMTQELLDKNGWDWDEARKLIPGTRVKI